jgi:hypothetical protein
VIVQFKGLDLGDDSDYIVNGFDGWEDRPEITNGSSPRPHSLGSWVGGLGSQKRVITLDLLIPGLLSDDNQTTIPMAKLRQVMGLDDQESPLLVGLDYGTTPEIANVRVTAFNAPTRKGYGRLREAFIEFTATDPRKYSNGVYSATTGLPTPPRVQPYPITYGVYSEAPTGAQRGEAQVENLGNAATPAVYRIIGPSAEPTITVLGENGWQKRTTFHIPLGAGEVLEVDTAKNTVTLNGSTRYGQSTGALVGQLEVPPGKSVVALGGGGGTDQTQLTVKWRDANL